MNRRNFRPKVLAPVKLEDLPKFKGTYKGNDHPVYYVERMAEYFRIRQADVDEYLPEIIDTLGGSVGDCYRTAGREVTTFEEFSHWVLKKYWSSRKQQEVRDRIIRTRYTRETKGTRSEHMHSCVNELRRLRPRLSEDEVVTIVIGQYEGALAGMVKARETWTVESLAEYLESTDSIPTEGPKEVLQVMKHENQQSRNGRRDQRRDMAPPHRNQTQDVRGDAQYFQGGGHVVNHRYSGPPHQQFNGPPNHQFSGPHTNVGPNNPGPPPNEQQQQVSLNDGPPPNSGPENNRGPQPNVRNNQGGGFQNRGGFNGNRPRGFNNNRPQNRSNNNNNGNQNSGN